MRGGLSSAVGNMKRDERLKPASLGQWAKAALLAAAARIDRLAWRTKLVATIVASFGLLFLLGPLGLTSQFSEQLRSESLERGMALVELLAASNAAAFKDQQDVLFSTSSVNGQSGVKAAYLSDADGMIVAPVDLYGRRVDAVLGLSTNIHERAGEGLRVYRVKGGEYLLTHPVVNYAEEKGAFERLVNGVAYVRFDADAVGWWYAPVQTLKFLVIAVLIGWGWYALLRRWTLKPMQQLAEQSGSNLLNATALSASGIRFDEVDSLCASRLKEEQGGTAAGAYADAKESAPLWQLFLQLGIADALVLDADKRIASVHGRMQNALKCDFEQGTHLLDHTAGGAGMDALMKLLVEMDTHPGVVRETDLDRSNTLVGTYVGDGGGVYVVTLRKKKRR